MDSWRNRPCWKKLVLLGRWNNFIGVLLLFQICYHKKGYLEPHCCTVIWDWNNFSFSPGHNQELQSWLVLVWTKISETDSESKSLNPNSWTNKWDHKTLPRTCGKQMDMLLCFLPPSSSKCAGSPCSWMLSKELHCDYTSELLHVCDTLSFVFQAFPWGSKSSYLPS